ncbi:MULTISPECIES: hypothetical protein [unclassified Pseudomonas]|uniref:hypothetical protein n=1 Tax=unclassified Pseudomonas TaxID=196821 RepID=UPI002448A7A8|nr:MULTISPECIES: hypothetical protein [unclassified Pseudomonas]MDG9928275.1 hypothetical protein [Pseudomonas sp. GD04042]MDH0481161.1 hypothetical protein [Pseudomonas sp. GD04015]MDH0604497.1 hypothetical protein [Pseudomonas sp. GD03869]
MKPVYRDVRTAIARIMSIEANDGTAKAPWQRRYQAPGSEGAQMLDDQESLSPEERMAQDSMARGVAHRVLPPEQWHALVAKYSINDSEVGESVRWLIPRVVSPAHHLFKTKCVFAWAHPQKAGTEGAKTSRYAAPGSFYDVSTWDSSGTPDRTLRRWRKVTELWLNDRVNHGHQTLDVAFTAAGLMFRGDVA